MEAQLKTENLDLGGDGGSGGMVWCVIFLNLLEMGSPHFSGLSLRPVDRQAQGAISTGSAGW